MLTMFLGLIMLEAQASGFTSLSTKQEPDSLQMWVAKQIFKSVVRSARRKAKLKVEGYERRLKGKFQAVGSGGAVGCGQHGRALSVIGLVAPLVRVAQGGGMRDAGVMVMVVPVYTWEMKEEERFREKVGRMLAHGRGKISQVEAREQEILMAVMAGWLVRMMPGNSLGRGKRGLILGMLLCIQGVETGSSWSSTDTWRTTLARSSANRSTKARVQHHVGAISKKAVERKKVKSESYRSDCFTIIVEEPEEQPEDGCLKMRGLVQWLNVYLHSSRRWEEIGQKEMQKFWGNGHLKFDLDLCQDEFTLNVTHMYGVRSHWEQVGNIYRGHLDPAETNWSNLVMVGLALYGVLATYAVFWVSCRAMCWKCKEKEEVDKSEAGTDQRQGEREYLELLPCLPSWNFRIEEEMGEMEENFEYDTPRSGAGPIEQPRRTVQRPAARPPSPPPTPPPPPPPGTSWRQEENRSMEQESDYRSPTRTSYQAGCRARRSKSAAILQARQILETPPTTPESPPPTPSPPPPPTPPPTPPLATATPLTGGRRANRIQRTSSIILLMLLLACGVSGTEKGGKEELSADFLERLKGVMEAESAPNTERPDQEEELDQAEEVLVVEGGMAELDCTDRDRYQGSIKWAHAKHSGPLPEGSEKTGRSLKIPNPEDGLEVNCIISKGKLGWVQRFRVKHATKESQGRKERLPELIEGYSCADPDTTPIARMSTREMGLCKEETFSTYKEEEMGKMVVLARKRVSTITIRRCSVSVTVKMGHCSPKFKTVGSQSTVHKGAVLVSADMCAEMFRTGTGKVELGPDTLVLAGINVTSSPRHYTISLSGSRMTKQGCEPATREIFMGGDYPRKVETADAFVTGDIVVLVDEEQGYVDYSRRTVSVPRLGTHLDFKEREGGIRVEGQNPEYGRFFADVQDEVTGGYSIASEELEAIVYTDQTPAAGHPNVAVLQLGDDKKMALQLGSQVMVLNTTKCYATHVSILLLCQSFFPLQGMKWDTEVLETVGSQMNLFLQLNINKSITKLLMLICENRRLGFQLAVARSDTSHLPFDLGPGTLSVARGEEVVVFGCALTVIRPSLAPETHCFDELPVIAMTEFGAKKMYLQARTRILIQHPSPVECSENFPVRFYLSEKVSICQTKPGLAPSICKSSEILQPEEGMGPARLDTLRQSESVQGATFLLADIKRVILDFITASSFRKSLSNTITQNRRRCQKGTYWCDSPFMHEPGIRRELSRQGMSFFDYVTQSSAWMWIDFISGLWCVYAMTTGILCWIVKTKQMCSQGDRKFTCCQMLIAALGSLDAAINPLNLTKIKFKWKIRELSANVMSLQAVVDELMVTIRSLMERMSELEKRLNELEATGGRITELGTPLQGSSGDATRRLRLPRQANRKLSTKKQSMRMAPRNILKLGSKLATTGRRVKFADELVPTPPPRSRRSSLGEDLPPPPSQDEMDILESKGEEQKLLHDAVTVTRPRLRGQAVELRAQVHAPPTGKGQAPPPPNLTTLTLRRQGHGGENKD